MAILLLKIDAFCQNSQSHLRGQEMLRERHLEMLGYKVVQVNYLEWSALYMSVPGAKLNYLKNLLQIALWLRLIEIWNENVCMRVILIVCLRKK